jgi:hypothetical protein
MFSLNRISGSRPGEITEAMLEKTVFDSYLSDTDKNELRRIREYNLGVIGSVERFLGGETPGFAGSVYWQDTQTATQPLLPAGITA